MHLKNDLDKTTKNFNFFYKKGVVNPFDLGIMPIIPGRGMKKWISSQGLCFRIKQRNIVSLGIWIMLKSSQEVDPKKQHPKGQPKGNIIHGIMMSMDTT
jgi:hypothetical protein